MNYVLLTNGRPGLEILRWLMQSGHPPTGLVVHPENRARCRKEIIETAGLSAHQMLEAPELVTNRGLAWLKAQQPDWVISVLYGYILNSEAISIPRIGALNLHLSLLPHNRGAYPNVWSIVDRTPAGVTLHYINDGIDTGDIATQREIPVRESDTGGTLYARLEEAAISLFRESWPAICANTLERKAQSGPGTFHRVVDAASIDRIDPEKAYRAKDLIDILRARSFPPHKGAYLDFGDRRIYLSLELIEERT